jgi:hypothetical protein
VINVKDKLLENNHNWTSETIEILENYFNEFNSILGNFVNVDSIIQNFIKSDNLKNGIIYVEEKMINGNFDAVYNFKELCIKITRNNYNKNHIKYLLFHEITHAISKHDSYIGFSDFSNSNIGINEGTTELISMLRNNKIGYKFNNEGIYNIVTSLSYLLATILDFKEIFQAYFTDYNYLKELIESKNMSYNEILECFDYFVDKEYFFIKKIFSYDMKNYTRIILYNFLDSFGEINTLELFDKKMKFMSLYIKLPFSLNNVDEYSTYIEILIDKNKLLELKISEYDIDNILKKYNLYSKEKFSLYLEQYNNEKNEGSENNE